MTGKNYKTHVSGLNQGLLNIPTSFITHKNKKR
jgi:hypothetical protein